MGETEAVIAETGEQEVGIIVYVYRYEGLQTQWIATGSCLARCDRWVVFDLRAVLCIPQCPLLLPLVSASRVRVTDACL